MHRSDVLYAAGIFLSAVGTCASPDCPLVDNLVDNQQAARPRDSHYLSCARTANKNNSPPVSLYSCVQLMSGAFICFRSLQRVPNRLSDLLEFGTITLQHVYCGLSFITISYTNICTTSADKQ